MDSKNTKAMQQLRTEKRLKATGPVNCIGKHSLGLKNFCRGRDAENIVLRHYQNLGYRLKKQRYRIHNHEIDLVLEDPKSHLTIVEIKSVKHANFISSVFSQKQKNKYRQLITALRESGNCVDFHLVILSPDNKITLIESALE